MSTPEQPEHLKAVAEQELTARREQIKATLACEWRLKTEHGIHHDHLSDLAFLLVEVEAAEAEREALRAQLERTEAVEREHGKASLLQHTQRERDNAVIGADKLRAQVEALTQELSDRRLRPSTEARAHTAVQERDTERKLRAIDAAAHLDVEARHDALARRLACAEQLAVQWLAMADDGPGCVECACRLIAALKDGA